MNKVYELNSDEFKHEIASIFNVDKNRDLFDIQEDVFNILQNRELLELNQEKQIELYKVRIEEENIECYFMKAIENTERDCIFLIFENYNEAKKYFEEYGKEEVYEPDI